MSHPPLRRFLGLDEQASDRSLLGLSPEEAPDTRRITDALEARLVALDRHPGARTPAAAAVRRRLGEAAGRLMAGVSVHPATPPAPPVAPAARTKTSSDAPASTPTERSPSRPEPSSGRPAPRRPGTATVATLTEFDRTVLAILVGSGGWNQASRGRLIGLAAQRGIGPAALMRIVSGLAELLHGGEFESIAGTARAIDVARVPAPPRREPSRLEVRMNQLSEVLASEFRGETSGARTRLGILFAGIAIGLVGLFTALLMMPSPVAEAERRERNASQAEDRRRAEASAQAVPEDPGLGRGFLEDGASGNERGGVLPATWERTPGFPPPARRGREMVLAQDASRWLEPLEVLARKAALPQTGGSPRVLREFRSFVEDGGACWPLLDPALRGELVAALAALPAGAADPEVGARFIDAFADELTTFEGPGDVWRSSWCAGVLGAIRSDARQSEAARQQAGDRLVRDLGGDRRAGGSQARPFDAAAGRKLDALVDDLFVLAANEQEGTYRAWEHWFDAQRAVRKGALLDAALLDAVLVVLEQGYALERPGMTVDVLARLLAELDFSARSHDPELMRMNLRAWLESDDIPSDNLWVLTSLLAGSIEVPWWDEGLVLSPGASRAERLALAERVESAWPDRLPTERPRGIPVPGDLLQRLELLHATLVDETTPGTQPAILHRLLAAARLTASAEAFESGDAVLGLAELEAAEALAATPHAPSGLAGGLSAEPGRTQQRDGVWSEQWKRSTRDLAERQSQLRRLKQRTDGDLGPVDAATLAQEAYRGAPRDIRLLAQEVVVERYANGPNMILALLDRFENAPLSQDTRDFLHRFTAETLPPLSDEDFRRAGRLVLADRAFALRSSELHDVDRLIEGYAAILRNRLEQLGGSSAPGDAGPQAIAGALASLLERRASSRFVTAPIPAPLEELERRRSVRWASARGAAQQLASELASLVDLATFESGTLRPDLRRELIESHADLTSRVAVAPDVLRQLLMLELALGELVIMRLEAEEAMTS